MIYVIGGIKGGSGKSKIATNLTIELAKQGHDILLIDADDQATASYFMAFRNETKQEEVGYTSIQLANKAVRNQTLRLKKSTIILSLIQEGVIQSVNVQLLVWQIFILSPLLLDR